MKKTKKYYRDQIAKGYDEAAAVIREAVFRYGHPQKTRGWREAPIDHVSNSHNGEITGFNITRKVFLVDVYWQGDSTDGDNEVMFDKDGIELAAEWDDITKSEVHSAVEFDSDKLYEAMKNFAAKYLK